MSILQIVVHTDFAICCTENVSLLAPSDPELPVIAEAKFLEVIFTPPPPPWQKLFETEYFLYKQNVYGNLKSVNSQDYA
jgi:hypothetical protein